MKAVVTGSNGTLGRVLCRKINEARGEVFGWDRLITPPGDEDCARKFLEYAKPDYIFHTALPSKPSGMENEGWIVNEKWTADIARLAKQLNVPLVYTSTVMVFTNKAQGPFTPETPPDETEGYGQSKLLGEKAAREANPESRIARLGWQIGHETGSNNMFHYLQQQQDEGGEVRASTKWLPATSFLEDTADALIKIAQSDPGTYHIDSNEGWHFYEIASALSAKHGDVWNVVPTEDFTQDQRMTDPKIEVASLKSRLQLPQLD